MCWRDAPWINQLSLFPSQPSILESFLPSPHSSALMTRIMIMLVVVTEVARELGEGGGRDGFGNPQR